LLKGIIFDFDGVISESVGIKSDAFASLYASYGEEIVFKVIEHHEKNGGMSRYKKIKFYHEFFLNKTITKKELTDLADQFSDLVVEKVIESPYVPGVLDYINKCIKHYKLFISTGTPTVEIIQILQRKKISKYFTDIFGSPNDKESHVEKIVSKYNFEPKELIFIGDSKTDLETALNTGIRFILRETKYNKDLKDNYNLKTIKNFINMKVV